MFGRRQEQEKQGTNTAVRPSVRPSGPRQQRQQRRHVWRRRSLKERRDRSERNPERACDPPARPALKKEKDEHSASVPNKSTPNRHKKLRKRFYLCTIRPCADGTVVHLLPSRKHDPQDRQHKRQLQFQLKRCQRACVRATREKRSSTHTKTHAPSPHKSASQATTNRDNFFHDKQKKKQKTRNTHDTRARANNNLTLDRSTGTSR